MMGMLLVRKMDEMAHTNKEYLIRNEGEIGKKEPHELKTL